MQNHKVTCAKACTILVATLVAGLLTAIAIVSVNLYKLSSKISYLENNYKEMDCFDLCYGYNYPLR